MVLNNRGRLINFISGINGVSAGGQAVINMPVNLRYHRLILQTLSGASQVNDAVTDVIDSIKLIVNGVSIRDIAPADILRLCNANGYIPKLGELPILFTEPFGANVNEPPDVTSWDLFGQTSFSIQIGIKSGVTNPGITGIYEFDYQRNLRPNGKAMVPFLQPVAHHSFSVNAVAGRNDINTIPFSYPTRRLWLRGSTPGDISQVELIQDGNKVFEATTEQLVAAARQYGFKFSQLDFMPFQNATGPADLSVNALVETPVYFDAAFISDLDSRWWKSLKVAQSLILRVTSDSAQTITVVQESLPGSFAS